MVRPTEKPSNSSQAQVVKEKWDKDIIYSYNGVIKCIFYDSSYSGKFHNLIQWFPTFFCKRTPEQKKITPVPLSEMWEGSLKHFHQQP